MTDDARVSEVVPEITAEFERVLTQSVASLPPSMASYLAIKLCEAWQEKLRNVRIRVPAGRCKVDGDLIEADWHLGTPIGEITRRHNISRRTAYRYHPSHRG